MKKAFFIIIVLIAAGAIFILSRPILSKNKRAASVNISAESGNSDKNKQDKAEEEKNNFLFGNWKLKGEESDRVNFLILGTGGERHEAGYLTDTIIIASYSPSKNKLGMVSVPRDLFVKMPQESYFTRINAIKYRGDKKGGKGIENLKESIAEISGLKIHYYAVFDFLKFKELIDQLGGIDIALEEALRDPLFPKGESEGYEEFSLDAGIHHLNGSDALKLARSRYSVWGDFDRSLRQQKVLEAIFNKIKENPEGKLEAVFKAFNLWNYFRKNTETDIGLLEARRILEIFQNAENTCMINKVLTSKSDGELVNARIKMKDGIAMVLLPKDESWEEIHKIAREILE